MDKKSPFVKQAPRNILDESSSTVENRWRIWYKGFTLLWRNISNWEKEKENKRFRGYSEHEKCSCMERKWKQRTKARRKYQVRHFIIEGYQVCQAWHPLGKSMLTTPDDLLVIHVPGNSFQHELLCCFPRNWGEGDQPIVLWVLLLALHEHRGVTFAFLQSSGISPGYDDHSKIIQRAVSHRRQPGPSIFVHPIKAHGLMYAQFA